MNKVTLILLTANLLLFEQAFSFPFVDHFDDGILAPEKWERVNQNGDSTESDGAVHFTVTSSFGSSSMIKFKELIPATIDFRVTADFSYQPSDPDSGIRLGLDLHQIDSNPNGYSAQASASNSGWVEVASYSNLDMVYDYTFPGQFISSSFRLLVDYYAIDQRFTFSVFSSGEKVGESVLSLVSDPSADISQNWNLNPTSLFELRLGADRIQDSVSSGVLALDYFEVTPIPEANYFGIVIGTLFLTFSIARRRSP